jgi:predicted heme/steroid binding protein/uncharacterized membrane protein
MKEFAPEEISLFNGKDGKPVYIVHQGKVYDVSNSKLWKGGLHMRRHHAGEDLTTDIGAAPHGPEVLERYPQVGIVLPQETEDAEMPEAISRFLKKYPMLRRHPHPMTVHFPIVFMFAATFFNILYLLSGAKSLETTALHCLAAGILFTPVVILTGLFSWWINYLAKPLRPVNIKIATSLLLLGLSIIAFTWRMAVPDILSSFGLASSVYFLLILSFAPLVSVIGWFGAQMTFPIERD